MKQAELDIWQRIKYAMATPHTYIVWGQASLITLPNAIQT